MAQAPILKTIAQRDAVEAILDPVLLKFGIRDAFDAREIQIRDQAIVESAGNKSRFSDAVFNCMFPKLKTPAELLHYTKMDGLRGIASSGELRLYPILKRIGQGELDAFAIAHKLNGYLNKGPGRPYCVDLSEDLFYVSLARTGAANEPYMWSVFAERGKGVRLKLRLTPDHGDLRGVQYAQASRTLLNRINDALTWENQPPFVPWTISRIGGFYLPSNLNVEDEVRLMIKRHKDGSDLTRSDGRYDYWPVTIGTKNPVCIIELIAIECGPNAVRAEVAAAIAGTALAGASIT
jgi:hypothetical protein